MPDNRQPDYGNWIRVRIIVILICITVFFAIGIFLPWHLVLRIISGIIAVIFFSLTAVIIATRYLLSPRGGDYQQKLYDMVIQNLGFSGRGACLDIGAANGGMIINLLKRYPECSGTGLDYWGKDWEYSKQKAEVNAVIEGVSQRVTFVKGSASSLPFPDEYFDAVISNLTFHEVKDSNDIYAVLREAFRVLKPGGRFSFLDPFLDKSEYGDETKLRTHLNELGLKHYSLVKLDSIMPVPRILRIKQSLGLVGVLCGQK